MSNDGNKTTTIAVTGSNRGIGAAIARELARRGFKVACLTRKGVTGEAGEGVDEAVAARLSAISCDITDEASIKAAFENLAAQADHLAGVVNCAGIINNGRSSDYPRADFDAMLQTNVLGTFSVCQAAYPLLAEQGEGLIVNIGSFWDMMGVKQFAAYCASKAAVGALTRCLGVEWGKKGIRVLDVAPGYIETDMTSANLHTEATQRFLESRLPLGRVGQPEEIARVVASLFLEPVGFLTATTIYVDGGQGPAM